jgi:anti-sigma factor RsiW
MNPCDEYSVKRSCYLDNRLQARELDDFRAHMEECAHCRAEVEADQTVSRLLRGTRPL